jgi:adenine/guanine phosphoribosyltransferase-like PRPP-binding protein
MSIADELNVYMFPDDIPINLANANDLKLLSTYFKGKEIYIVVGSDVILNASAYKARLSKYSIHNFNHIIFKRSADYISSSPSIKKIDEAKSRIKGKIVELQLPVYLEDISSTQIRDNIDNNRDISNLIDPLAQSFIYERNLYLREPQYKSILKSKPFKIEIIENMTKSITEEIGYYIFMQTNLYENVGEKFVSKNTKLAMVRDTKNSNKLLGFSVFHDISASDVFSEMKSSYIANYVRERTAGRIIVIDGIFVNQNLPYDSLEQIVVTETLAYCMKNDFTYAIYNSVISETNKRVNETLELQGFVKLSDADVRREVYVVDMKFPICLTLNLESFIKEPLNSNPKVHEAIVNARKRLQKAMTELYPDNLVLSFDNDMINQTLIQKICSINKVPDAAATPRMLGEYMCVPFGNILKGMVVPNTVTKSLHTEKVYETDLKTFRITESPSYSTLSNQIKTIKSFDRPVILVDDLLHKGYRIKGIDPILKSHDIKVEKIIVGIMSGRGKDLLEIQGREMDCAYYVPSLRIWFNENLMYPFLGGDGVMSDDENVLNLIPSVNLILPYVAPPFISGTENKAVYNLSMVSLENTKNILRVLEAEYQDLYERNLTVKRLGEVLISPRYPYLGKNICYDLNIEPSGYMDVAIENLIKLERIIK